MARPRYSLIHLLHRAGQCAEALFGEAVEVVTPRQLVILTTLAGSKGMSQTSLVDQTGVDRSTMTGLVERLVGKGLVERRRIKSDARANLIRITDEGLRVVEQAEPIAKRVESKILMLIPAKSRHEFLEELRRMVVAMEKSMNVDADR